MTPLPPFDVLTPLGPAECIGVVADGDRPEWVCFIHATGEPWWFPNQLVRRFPWASYPERGVSPFSPTHINAKLAAAILRYQDKGWLLCTREVPRDLVQEPQ